MAKERNLLNKWFNNPNFPQELFFELYDLEIIWRTISVSDSYSSNIKSTKNILWETYFYPKFNYFMNKFPRTIQKDIRDTTKKYPHLEIEISEIVSTILSFYLESSEWKEPINEETYLALKKHKWDFSVEYVLLGNYEEYLDYAKY